MPIDVHRLAPKRALQPFAFNPNGKLAKQKLPNRHLVDNGVEPFDEEQFDVRCFAIYFDRGVG